MFWLHRGYNVHCSPQFGIFWFSSLWGIHNNFQPGPQTGPAPLYEKHCFLPLVRPSYFNDSASEIFQDRSIWARSYVNIICHRPENLPSEGNAHLLQGERLLSRGPLFVLADNRPLTRTSFVTMLRVVLGKLGLDSTLYAGHSFRIGAATTAAAAGLPDWLIQALGRWSSACYLRYIRVPLTSLNQASTTLANASNVW